MWNTSSQIYKLRLLFLSTLVLREQSKWRTNKSELGEVYNAHPKVRSKVIKNEIKVLTHHETIDRIAEKTVLVITQMCIESKLWIHPNLRRPSFSFTYLFKFTYFYIVDAWTLKKNSV